MPNPRKQADTRKPSKAGVEPKTKADNPPEAVAAEPAAAEHPAGAMLAPIPEIAYSAGAPLVTTPPPLSREQMHRLRQKLKAKFH